MTSKKAITIRDIARHANVSYQTVSLVINNRPGVSERTRRRIQRLMDEMGYRPNRAAQMLTTNTSKIIELIMVDLPFDGRLPTIAHATEKLDYSLLLSEVTAERLGTAFADARARMVDGVILYAPQLTITDEALIALSQETPFVRRDYVPGSQVAWVGFDQVYATRLAVEHLLELGHRRIAAIPPETNILNGYWRTTTWKAVLMEHGLDPGPSYPGDYGMNSGYQAAKCVLESDEPFTALVVGNDTMAFAVLKALHEYGMNVPGDVSVISYDNVELAGFTVPALTTVEFAFEKQDELAVQFLSEIIENPDMERHQRVLTPTLVIRDSTAAPSLA